MFDVPENTTTVGKDILHTVSTHRATPQTHTNAQLEELSCVAIYFPFHHTQNSVLLVCPLVAPGSLEYKVSTQTNGAAHGETARAAHNCAAMRSCTVNACRLTR